MEYDLVVVGACSFVDTAETSSLSTMVAEHVRSKGLGDISPTILGKVC